MRVLRWVLIAQLAFFAIWGGWLLTSHRVAETVWLATRPVDPRDLLAGHYVALRYTIETTAESLCASVRPKPETGSVYLRLERTSSIVGRDHVEIGSRSAWNASTYPRRVPSEQPRVVTSSRRSRSTAPLRPAYSTSSSEPGSRSIMALGTLSEIHRYPVKSMLGESLERVALGAKGIPGDRAWAIRDEVRGGIEGGKKIPGLMSCAARYLEEPGLGEAPAPEIRLPSGDVFRASDPEAAQRIGACVEREVTLWPLLPADALDHYRRGQPDDPDLEKELRAIFGRQPDEPLPDISKFPPELFEFNSPPGTYFDAFPLLVLSEQSLRALTAAAPDSMIDVRRFRPNLVVNAVGPERFPEQEWIGKRLRIGGAVVSIAMECPRCVMTTHGFADVPKDPGVMRKLVQEAAGNFGVYASVESPGEVKAGDPIELA